MLIWNPSFPNWIDYCCSHFSDPTQEGMNTCRVSLRGPELGEALLQHLHSHPVLQNTCSPSGNIEIYKRSLEGSRKVIFLLPVGQVTHWQNSSVDLTNTQKAHILKGEVQTPEGPLTQEGKRGSAHSYKVAIEDRCSNNIVVEGEAVFRL